MFDDAKAMAEAGILAETPGLDRLALKRALFRRLFGRDFTEEKIEKITRCIATER